MIVSLWGLFKAEARIEEAVIIKQVEGDYLERMEQLGIQCPEVVVAQICLETNYLTSAIYKENNNLFGMKKPYKRPTYVIGVNRGHAVYATPAHSVADYLLFQQHVGRKYLERRGKEKFNNNEEYLDFLLRCGYAEDQKYINKLKKIIQTLYQQ